MKNSAWTSAKKKYLKWYQDNYDYIHCLNEDCDDPNRSPHDVHHIISRARAPKNRHLHKKENLIMLCMVCHNKFHHANTKEDSNEAKRLTGKWINERGLTKIFKDKL